MHGVNCWLMGLSFLLGLLLTFAFTIRRVEREVPASAAKLIGGTVASAAETTQIAVGGAPYGEGSARAGAGGSGPAGWTIKGNEDSMLFHTPDSPWYEQTVAEVWFAEEKVAEAAGFSRWDTRGDNKK